jgi:predicted regulator of Ras-like GTPase activity (Roadblock/LC7/MglB family)
MPLEGSLKELSLANLIQLNCQEKNEVTITLEYLGKEGVIYCSKGNLVHATTGSLSGENAVVELLHWQGGNFRVENSAAPAEKTIKKSWDSLLMDAMQRIDEGETSQEDKFSKLAKDLVEMATVEGAVIVSRDGAILGEAVDGNAEKEGAVAVFLGNSAAQIGDVLSLGALDWGLINLGKSRLLVLEKPNYFVGLLLGERASPSMLVSRVSEALVGLE